MAQELRAAVTAAFGEGAGTQSGIRLTIENDPGAVSDVNKIYLLLFPAVAATLRATVGSVSALGTPKPVTVPGGVITMQGTTAALPKRADVTVPVLKVELAADKNGVFFDPGIVFDPAAGTITAARE